MKTSIRFVAVLAVFAGARATAGEADGEKRETITFEGVMAVDKDVAFALRVPGERATRWMRIGETFADHRLEAFEAAAQTLVLRRNGGEVRVALKPARVVAGLNEVARATETTRQKVRENLRYLAVAAKHFFAATGRERAEFSDLVGEGKAIEVLRPVVGENYATVRLERGAARLAIELPDGGAMEIGLADVRVDDDAYRQVREGESVEQIAATGGAPVQRVLELNELAEGGAVRAGRLLRLK